MKLNVLVLCCLVFGSCNGNGLASMKPAVDVEIVNKSTRDLRNSGVHFSQHVCELGNVGKTFTAIYLFYPKPITSPAELQWDESGGHRVEKFDLSKVYSRGKAGCLTFTVYDDHVEVSFQEKS
jgi:hypothetical protein